MPNILSELLVQGVRQSLSQALSQGLSGALSGSISSLASRGLLSGLSFSDPGMAAAVARAQANLPAQPAATPTPPTPPATPVPAPSVAPTDVAPVTVVGAPAPAPTGALGQVIAGAAGNNRLVGTAGTDTLSQPSQDQGSDNRDQGNEVAGLTVTPSTGIPPAALLLPAGAAGAALLAGGGGGAATTPPQAPTDVEGLDVVGTRPPPVPQLDPAALPGPVAGLTTMLPSTPDPVEVTPEHTLDRSDLLLPAGVGAVAGLVSGGPDTAGLTTGGGGNGGIGGTGITPTDLLAGGLLGGGLLGGSGGSSGSSDALKGLADKSAGLADRLGNIATAGFAGDIGGRGLNSISRMVRHAQAAIRQRYSAMGMSGSSAEGQDLQAAADAGVDLQFKVGQEMATAGLNAIAALTGQSAAIYTSLLNAQTAKDTALGNALANFAAALVH